MTTPARTRDAGKVAFQRAPGVNFNTSFLANALTVALHSRIEIGTIPLYYAVRTHAYNVNLKLNFYRSSDYDISVGYSKLAMAGELEEGRYKYTLDNSAYQIVGNYHPSFLRGSVTVMATHVQTSIHESRVLRQSERRQGFEFAADYSHPLNARTDVTVGAGAVRDFGISAYETSRLGFGTTVAYYRPKKFFSKPSFGVHFIPNGQTWKFLFGTEFY